MLMLGGTWLCLPRHLPLRYVSLAFAHPATTSTVRCSSMTESFWNHHARSHHTCPMRPCTLLTSPGRLAESSKPHRMSWCSVVPN
ncbi:hypothetical protein E2C01_096044 [Portunus trituberculatus]|uniref:Uncharacterized protein n=1 Tax=Portunus trituberculatus TaxID=210409 RepID=A0A5B7K782_PORTR|nr:hypothetical protein [Portunus trituberculatus]